MIIVTGTKRAGTSMWMQILERAGLPVIGQRFPGRWERSIKGANPRGFYECRFRDGVYYATNPDPTSGRFVTPAEVRHHAVKVFIPGLVRTDYGYMRRVIATVRSWREYVASLARLHALEDEFLARAADRDEGGAGPGEERPDDEPARDGRRRQSAGPLPPALEWWTENYALVRDIATRRYPVHVVTYARLLEDPETTIEAVMPWLGVTGLDVAAACAAVEPTLRTQQAKGDAATAVDDAGLDKGTLAVFDELHARLHTGGGLDGDFIETLNGVHDRLEPRVRALLQAG